MDKKKIVEAICINDMHTSEILFYSCYFPVDIASKLNVHKTFNFRPVSARF